MFGFKTCEKDSALRLKKQCVSRQRDSIKIFSQDIISLGFTMKQLEWFHISDYNKTSVRCYATIVS